MSMPRRLATRTIAIVVTYHPKKEALQQLIDRLVPQVDGLVIVDNGSEDGSAWAVSAMPIGFAAHIALDFNLGIATALNKGVETAIYMGATHLLLSDQDSLPAVDMVEILHATLADLSVREVPVAAVGPRYMDGRSGYLAPFLRTEGLLLKSVRTEYPGEPAEVDFLITSGCLVSAESWRVVGPMVDALFIDYVDIEWGLRARAKGLISYGVESTILIHTLGDRRMNFLGLSVPIHGPIRHYYQIRNPLWLYRQPWIPLNWKIVDGFRLLLRFIFYSTFTHPRIKNLSHMLRGFRDGLVGRFGPMERPEE